MEIMSMKRILLFLLLFCIFNGVIFAQSEDLPKIVVHPLINFDQIFVMLKQILMQLFLQYYHLLIGIAVVVMFLSYLQSILEGRRMREERERQEREYREQIEKRQIDQYLTKERNLIRRYAKVDGIRALEVQESMYQYDSTGDDEELGLAEDDDVLSNNVDRAGPFWRPDGSEEGYDPRELIDDWNDEEFDNGGGRFPTYWGPDGSPEDSDSDTLSGDTATINESSTVIIPEDKRKQDRIYRSMEDNDDYSGY
jgi:hypothetical protein